MINQNQVIILVGQTGSGKTTQIPQFLLQSGLASIQNTIACTQPRRVAAMSVAKRVSQQMDVNLGDQVGYAIRFQAHTNDKTMLTYMTDGMLLRQAMVDHLLSKYSFIILDQAHERTLNTDILFGLIKQVLLKRKDLKLIVMSATLDAQKFQQYFHNAPRLDIPGRTFPVDVFFSNQPQSDYVQASIQMAINIHRYQAQGDILLFLTGQQQIQIACARIQQQIRQLGDSVGFCSVIPLYSTLPPQMQQRIFDAPPKTNRNGIKGRKIIVSTNIAQTSITIDGIVYVIDPGFSKQKVFNPRMRVQSLLVSPISKASAKQRAGRAGRTKPGKCYRLYTQASYNQQLIQNTYPQILRSNLASTILSLKRLGIQDLVHFDFMDPPAPQTLMRALDLLNSLGALDDEGNLTQLGQNMSQFPLQPQLSKVLLTAPQYNVSEQILTIVACMSSPNVFMRPKQKLKQASDAHAKFINRQGDHITIMNAFHQYKNNKMDLQWCQKNFLNHRHLKSVDDVRQQLKQMLVKMGIKIYQKYSQKPDAIAIKKCLLTGFFTQIGILQKNNVYLTLKDSQVVDIHPGCILNHKPLFVMYQQLVLTKKNYMRTVSSVNPQWFFEIAPQYFDPQTIRNAQSKRQLQKVKNKLFGKKK